VVVGRTARALTSPNAEDAARPGPQPNRPRRRQQREVRRKEAANS
jgi:hypothetical protein